MTEITFGDFESSSNLHSSHYTVEFEIASFQKEAPNYFKTILSKRELSLLLRCKFLLLR